MDIFLASAYRNCVEKMQKNIKNIRLFLCVIALFPNLKIFAVTYAQRIS